MSPIENCCYCYRIQDKVLLLLLCNAKHRRYHPTIPPYCARSSPSAPPQAQFGLVAGDLHKASHLNAAPESLPASKSLENPSEAELNFQGEPSQSHGFRPGPESRRTFPLYCRYTRHIGAKPDHFRRMQHPKPSGKWISSVIGVCKRHPTFRSLDALT